MIIFDSIVFSFEEAICNISFVGMINKLITIFIDCDQSEIILSIGIYFAL
jgi:hypothetical protein